MSSCCDPYSAVFDEKQSRKDLRRYRRRGLQGLAGELVEYLGPHAEHASVLEIGGGIGAIQIELMSRGASRSVNIEMSSEYEASARQLIDEAGFGDRVHRHVGDFVARAGELDRSDIVVLNKVVCCYPDMEAMVGAATDKAAHRLAMVFPRDRWFMRGLRLGIAALMRVRRTPFRFFIHDPAAIRSKATSAGMSEAFSVMNRGWEGVVFERPAQRTRGGATSGSMS